MQVLRKLWSNKVMLAQMIAFAIAKIVYSLVQLPHEEKERTYVIELLVCFTFYFAAIGLKIYRHKTPLVVSLPRTMMEAFLLWIVTLLVIMFSLALEDKLKWAFIEKTLSIMALTMQTLGFILLMNHNFISKRQFVLYQIILAANVVNLAYKCIWFLTYEDENGSKDVLLLNLTTQIALSIIIMDTLERSYSQYRKIREQEKKMTEESNQMHKELTQTH